MTKEQETDMYASLKRQGIFDDPVAAIEAESRRIYLEHARKLETGEEVYDPFPARFRLENGKVTRLPDEPLEQGPLPNWKPLEWMGGPVQIHDVRFVWWYRAWLWIKFRVFRQKIGFYYAKPQKFDPCDYKACVLDYAPKYMKKPKLCQTMENNPPR